MINKVVPLFSAAVLTFSKFVPLLSGLAQKVTKMGSITGHKIEYNGVGVLREQRHKPTKIGLSNPPGIPGNIQTFHLPP